MKTLLISIIGLGLLSSPIVAEDVPVSSDRWEIEGKSHKFETFMGKETIFLNQSSMTLKGLDFENGTLEYDVYMTYERGFSGIRFRAREDNQQDMKEEFYIRSHLSGKPDATQYTPVFNGNAAWQLYHGPQYSTPYIFKENEWLHVKINVVGEKADIYLGDMTKPALTVGTLKTGLGSGKVSLFANFTPRYFANFSYSSDTPSIIGTAAPMPETPDTRIKTWNVSSPFDGALLEGKFSLEDDVMQPLTWSSLKAEEKGITNLSKVSKLSKTGNTVIVSKTLEATQDTDTTISFGYSDKVKVYLNGALLYSGSNGFRSRDYRYLGTIGLFDKIPLHLKKGKNIVHIAVSESFGGWGVMADIPKTQSVCVQ